MSVKLNKKRRMAAPPGEIKDQKERAMVAQLVVQVAKKVCWSLLAGPARALLCGDRGPDPARQSGLESWLYNI